METIGHPGDAAARARVCAAFIDRDGVINEELDYVHRIDDFHILPGVVDGLRLLRQHGFELVVVTNQAGIGRGLYTEADYQQLNAHMQAQFASAGAPLAAVYHCPHHPTAATGRYRIECNCRKPRPGMLLRAAQDLNLDLSRSVIVGDKQSDLEAGRAAGVQACVLVESGHMPSAKARTMADHVCANLLEAARWVVTRG
jgi:D-glycero-D-manno-heptose 1,7-bisphosphate phosphatase